MLNNLINTFKQFFKKNPIIESHPQDKNCICWQWIHAYKNQVAIKVELDQLVLLIHDQKIKAILERGEYSLNDVFEERVDDKLLRATQFFYFTTKTFTDQRWGTASPILVNDSKNGLIQIRAHGTFAYKLGNPKKLWRLMDSHAQQFKTDDLINHLRSLILNIFSSTVHNLPTLSEILSDQNRLSKIITDKLNSAFLEEGLQLDTFLIQNVSLTHPK
jgi:membrane protease subunit (stomatin/prohibitin family)